MVGFDVPHTTHDMILRFMGVNFSAIATPEGSALLPSALGKDEKPLPEKFEAQPESPLPPSTKPPQQEKAMWEGTSIVFCSLSIEVEAYFHRYMNSVLQRWLSRPRSRTHSHLRRCLLLVATLSSQTFWTTSISPFTRFGTGRGYPAYAAWRFGLPGCGEGRFGDVV